MNSSRSQPAPMIQGDGRIGSVEDDAAESAWSVAWVYGLLLDRDWPEGEEMGEAAVRDESPGGGLSIRAMKARREVALGSEWVSAFV